MVWGECYSLDELIENLTLVPLKDLYSLSEAVDMSLGSRFFEVSFSNFFWAFGSIIPISKEVRINFYKIWKSVANTSDDPFYDRTFLS